MSKRRTPLRGLVQCKRHANLLAGMLHSKSVEASLKAMLYTATNSIWRGIIATPPSSLLETIVAEFRRETAIPLELPFMSALSLVAQYMAEQGATLRLSEHQSVELDLYTIVLAASGRCKTYTYNLVAKTAALAGWQPRLLDETGSSAALLEALADAQGKPIYWRMEEWGEFWASLQSEHQRMTKRYLLMFYDHEPVVSRLKSRSKKNGELVSTKTEVATSCLSIFGTSVLDNVHKQLTPEDWRSGAVQRFGILVAQDDPARPWYAEEYAFLDTIDCNVLANAWRKAMQTPVCKQYVLTPGARKSIARTFYLLGRDSGIGEDFVRRIEFRIFKYAVLFHWLLGKRATEIDEEDVGWGARLGALHLEDLRYLLDHAEYSSYLNLFKRAVELKQKHGEGFSPRLIQMYLRHYVKGADEAKALYRLVLDAPESNKKRE